MLYELILYFQNDSYHALLQNISVNDGYVHAKLVGEFVTVDDRGNSVYVACKPKDYYAGGTYVLIEFKGKVMEHL